MIAHDGEIALRADRVIELVNGRACQAFRLVDTRVEKVRELIKNRSRIFDESD